MWLAAYQVGRRGQVVSCGSMRSFGELKNCWPGSDETHQGSLQPSSRLPRWVK